MSGECDICNEENETKYMQISAKIFRQSVPISDPRTLLETVKAELHKSRLANRQLLINIQISSDEAQNYLAKSYHLIDKLEEVKK